MAALVGRPLDGAALEAGLAALQGDVQIAADAPGGMSEFRRSLAASFLFKVGGSQGGVGGGWAGVQERALALQCTFASGCPKPDAALLPLTCCRLLPSLPPPQGLLHAALQLEADAPGGSFASPFPDSYRSGALAGGRARGRAVL